MDDGLAEFCEREHGRLVSALDLLCGSLPLAEDLAQETLARVCKDWARIKEMDAPGAYAHRIAMNLATSAFRRRAVERRARARMGPVDEEWNDPDPATAVAVRKALAVLRPEQRRVLVLRYFLNYSVAEVSELLRIPEGTTKTHAARGLAILREQLGTAVTSKDTVSEHA